MSTGDYGRFIPVITCFKLGRIQAHASHPSLVIYRPVRERRCARYHSFSESLFVDSQSCVPSILYFSEQFTYR
jgi:hypothetical protein